MHIGGDAESDPDQLPGVWQRTRAIDARVASGRWAALHIRLTHGSPDLALDQRGVRYRTDRTLRILLPLDPPLPEPSP